MFTAGIPAALSVAAAGLVRRVGVPAAILAFVFVFASGMLIKSAAAAGVIIAATLRPLVFIFATGMLVISARAAALALSRVGLAVRCLVVLVAFVPFAAGMLPLARIHCTIALAVFVFLQVFRHIVRQGGFGILRVLTFAFLGDVLARFFCRFLVVAPAAVDFVALDVLGDFQVLAGIFVMLDLARDEIELIALELGMFAAHARRIVETIDVDLRHFLAA